MSRMAVDEQVPPRRPGKETPEAEIVPYLVGQLDRRVENLEHRSIETQTMLARVEERMIRAEEKIDHVGRRMDSLETILTETKETLARVDQRLIAVEVRLDDVKKSLDTRLDDVKKSLDTRLDDVKKSLDTQSTWMKWVLGLILVGIISKLFFPGL